MTVTNMRSDAELRNVGRQFAGLPMPRDAELCTDVSRRPRVRRETGPRFPFPIPNGWFIVAQSHELSPGEVMPLYYFGHDLVLFRTASGQPRLLDAYCAHLGANLAVGGRVEGEEIACPFHGWCYDGTSGRCTDIPYTESKRIPAKARVRAYPAIDQNGMIWAWHHLKGEAPPYTVPEVPEFNDPEWSEPDCREFVLNTCCQEMAENTVDFAHFKFVHGSPDIPADTHVVEGAYRRTESAGGVFVRESYALGLGVLRIKDAVTFISSTTPIDEESVHVRWIFTARANGPDAVKQVADGFLSAVSQDIPIWENKVYRPRPILMKEEKIMVHREWAKQFYSEV